MKDLKLIKPIKIETYPNKPYGPTTKNYNIVKIECILNQIKLDDLCNQLNLTRAQLRHFLTSGSSKAIDYKLKICNILKIQPSYIIKKF